MHADDGDGLEPDDDPPDALPDPAGAEAGRQGASRYDWDPEAGLQPGGPLPPPPEPQGGGAGCWGCLISLVAGVFGLYCLFGALLFLGGSSDESDWAIRGGISLSETIVLVSLLGTGVMSLVAAAYVLVRFGGFGRRR